MGWNIVPINTISLENCRIPSRNLVGQLGHGFTMAATGVEATRINIGEPFLLLLQSNNPPLLASSSLGGAAACLAKTQEYLLNRQQGDKKLAELQTIQSDFARLMTTLTAARLLTRNAARTYDEEPTSERKSTAISMAKCFATENCLQIADTCIQMHGGNGFLHDYGIEQIFRDIKATHLASGSNSTMNFLLGKQILLGAAALKGNFH